MRTALLVAGTLAVTACATAAPATGPIARLAPPLVAPPPASVALPAASDEPPFADPPAPLQGSLRQGAFRPEGRSIRFDVDSLPVATWGGPVPGAGFVLRPTHDGWSVFVRTTLYAEVVVSASASYQDHGTSSVGFSAYTASSFAAGNVPACGQGSRGKRLAVWGGMAPAGWTDDGVDVEMDEGDYDLSSCQALPKRSLRGRARAVVRGFVYALRVREQPGDDDRAPPEHLLVLLPRGAMVSASADPAMPIETTNTGTFTRLTLPIDAGDAGTASVRVGPASIRLWKALREGQRMPFVEESSQLHDDLLVGVDVIADVGKRTGTVSLALPRGTDRRPYARLIAAAKLVLPD